MIKICYTCKIKKPFTEFHKNIANLDKLQSSCKECKKKITKEWSFKNKEFFKKYYSKNKKKIIKYQKKWKLKNKEHVKKYTKEYYLKNKERKRIQNKQWKLKNKEYGKQWALKNKKKLREQERNRRKNNVNHRLAKNYRTALCNSLKKNKKLRSVQYLGCTIPEFWKFLEKKFLLGMTKENYGKWHLDHIKPCSSFNQLDPKQRKICWHYTNFQPLWAIDNLKKGSKLNYETQS